MELGYAVAPSRQGHGIATAAVAVLGTRAYAAGVAPVSAHTLAESNASTAVLRKHHFRHTADLDDPDVNTVWRWELSLRASPTPPPIDPHGALP